MGYNSETLTFDTDYIGVWYEEQNEHYRKEMQRRLRSGKPVSVVLQPGDGTRYEFILMPDSPAISISHDGREPGMSLANGNVVRAIILNGLGDGICAFNREYAPTDRQAAMENARYRIIDKMKVPNVCTREALAATIYALWYMDD